ncbi:MAG: TRAP transporter small permease [Dehalococcoidales bacterium]|nr:TRAP transporter small permease [Dehalococcoidales bacterium]
MSIKKFFSYIDMGIGTISHSVGFLSIIFLVFMMFLIVIDIFLRAVFNSPIPGTFEFTEFIMIIATFLGLPWATFMEAHIQVSSLTSKLSPRLKETLIIINYILVIGLCALISSSSYVEALAIRKIGIVSAITNIPKYPFYILVSIGYFLTFLVLIVQLVKSIKRAIKI